MTDARKTLPSRSHTGQGRVRLLCFPYAGGGPSIFRDWRYYARAPLEICPVSLPGRGSRIKEPASSKVQIVVVRLAAELAPLFEEPFAFFGYSMGALIAFELARHLETTRGSSCRPRMLIVAGRRAPTLPDVRSATYNLPVDAFKDELRRLQGTPPEILDDHELFDFLLPTLRADFQLVQTYRFQAGAQLHCQLLAIRGAQDSEVEPSSLDAWKLQTSGLFAKATFPGNHFFIHHAGRDILAWIGGQLQRMQLDSEQLTS